MQIMTRSFKHEWFSSASRRREFRGRLAEKIRRKVIFNRSQSTARRKLLFLDLDQRLQLALLDQRPLNLDFLFWDKTDLLEGGLLLDGVFCSRLLVRDENVALRLLLSDHKGGILHI